MADETTELRRAIHKEGYDTRQAPDGHIEVTDREGNVIRHKSGKPLRFAGTPSGGRSMKNAVSMLRDAGVLPRPSTAKAKDNGKGDKSKLSRDVLKQYSDTLRTEIEQLMKQYGLSQTHICVFADYWADQHGIAKPNWPPGVISKFLKGTSLSNANYVWLTTAASAIRRADGKIPSVEEIRQHKVKTEVPEEPPEEPGASIEVEGTSAPHTPRLPQLAMDAMQMIYRDEKDHDAIMALVQDIAKLEMQR